MSLRNVIDRQQDQLLQGQAVRSFKDFRCRHLWSTYHFQPGAGSIAAGDYKLFVAAAGKNGQGLPSGLSLDDLDTNFSGEGRVPDDQNLAVWELGVSLLPAREDVVDDNTAIYANGPMEPGDVDNVLSSAVLGVKFVDTELELGPLSTFSQPGGPHIAVPTLLDWTEEDAIRALGISGGMATGPAASPWQQATARLASSSGNLAPSPATRMRLDVPIFLGHTNTFYFFLRFGRAINLRTVARGGTGAFRARVDLWCAESFRETKN